ncbi:MAG TPA: DinB family protein [Candidatus Eisenbacteria bacterium]|nr:DinB family protein [Candidatus Eisenbacteria bacterium]
MSQTARPDATEHVPYFGRYTTLVPDGSIAETLRKQRDETSALLARVPADLEEHRYAEGKWSVKEVVGHLADGERVFTYRALRIARGDETPLASFDENLYVPAGRFDARTLESLAGEFRAVREATIRLLEGLDDAALSRRGTAAGNPVSARALFWIVAGHERHHVALLRERYGLR